MNKPLIVSRHPGAIAWLRENFPWLREAEVRESVTEADVNGRVVAGNLPLSLAAACGEFFTIEFSGPPPRGAEYTASDMDAAGARLTRYRVERVG